MSAVYEEACLSQKIVYKWAEIFKKGRKNVFNEDRLGRPTGKRTTTTVNPTPNILSDWLKNQYKKFYKEGMQKLVHRWQKCVVVQEDYVKKLKNKVSFYLHQQKFCGKIHFTY